MNWISECTITIFRALVETDLFISIDCRVLQNTWSSIKLNISLCYIQESSHSFYCNFAKQLLSYLELQDIPIRVHDSVQNILRLLENYRDHDCHLTPLLDKIKKISSKTKVPTLTALAKSRVVKCIGKFSDIEKLELPITIFENCWIYKPPHNLFLNERPEHEHGMEFILYIHNSSEAEIYKTDACLCMCTVTTDVASLMGTFFQTVQITYDFADDGSPQHQLHLDRHFEKYNCKPCDHSDSIHYEGFLH